MRAESEARVVRSGIAAGAALLLAGAWVVDLRRAVSAEPEAAWNWLPVASGAVMVVLAVAAVLARTRPARTAALGMCVLLTTVAASVACTAAPAPPGCPDGLAEVLAMAVAVTLIGYRCAAFPVALAAALTLAASLLSSMLRLGRDADLDAALVMSLLLAPGLLLRWRHERRQWQLERARQAERDALARDLHDVVAHHVTGIVVQVQAMPFLTDPQLARAALHDIEQAGMGALQAMQRLVTALRSGHSSGGPVQVGEELHALRRPGTRGRPAVEVLVTGDPGSLPTEVASAVVRIAQEAVTNAARHAQGATRIEVRLVINADRAELAVRDDGRPGTGFGSGGYGLVGMAERAELLGGTLRAGAATDGPGWLVTAEIPVARAALDRNR
ncbi:sensor histidine kinase [Saccharopolyspora sp. 5N102]|uniref:sensor histidine kinase n=1 Tax=Saccharopolyspora sp. 5N102 TaxID=3375155 RepID=UPI0037BCD1CE